MNELDRASSPGGGWAHLVVLNVVTVIGGLVTLGVAGTEIYLRHSKTAEAGRNLGSIELGSKMAFEAEYDQSGNGTGPFVHTFCESAKKPVPLKVPKGVKIAASSEYSAPTWLCLKFSINEPQFYQYDYQSNSKTAVDARYTATAHGDLDGDGETSTFELIGRGTSTGDASRVSYRITHEDD
jgi:hypothetical protein